MMRQFASALVGAVLIGTTVATVVDGAVPAGPEPTKAVAQWASVYPYPSQIGSTFSVTRIELLRGHAFGQPADYVSVFRDDLVVVNSPLGPTPQRYGYLEAGVFNFFAPPSDMPLGTISIDEAHRTYSVDLTLSRSRYCEVTYDPVTTTRCEPVEPVHVQATLQRTRGWQPCPGCGVGWVTAGGDPAAQNAYIDGELLADTMPPGFPYFDWHVGSTPRIFYLGALPAYEADELVDISCEAVDDVALLTNTCASINGPAFEFGLGAHQFSATATDTDGNFATASVAFEVIVTYRSISNLTTRWVAKEAIGRELAKKLAIAAHAEARGSLEAEANVLAAFRSMVSAQSGKALADEHAQILIDLSYGL